MKKLSALTSALSLLILAVVSNAHAADMSDVSAEEYSDPGQWTYEFSPYFWAPGLKGNVAMFGAPTAAVDVKFADLFDAIHWGDFPAVFMGNGEATNGTFGVYGDLLTFSLEVDAVTTPAPPVAVAAQLGLRKTVATAMGFYRAIDEQDGYLDVMAGARFWSVNGDLSLLAAGAGPIGGFARFAKDSDSWTDLMIGAKGRANITDQIFIKGWGMFGGFGIASDTSWDLYGAIGYQYNDWITFQAGWRYVQVDYTNGPFVMDVQMSGPMLEATFKF